MNTNLYSQLQEAKAKGQNKFAVLIDPDQLRLGKLDTILQNAMDANVDYFFIGGSLIVNDMLDKVLVGIRELCNIPQILFPGNSFQLSNKADALLFLSLISGRNAELLIGKHVITAPFLRKSSLEIMSTGYMLIDGGAATTVSYMSNTNPIPRDKNDIAVCTAMAGELLGLKMIYMDAGSGAQTPIPESMISAVSNNINIPLIIGGGIKTPEKALASVQAGADMIVVGNAIENDPTLVAELSHAVHSMNTTVNGFDLTHPIR